MKTFTEWEATTDGYSNSEKNLMELAWNASAENSTEEIERLRNAAPEIQQEPVAWCVRYDDPRCGGIHSNASHWLQEVEAIAANAGSHLTVVPLYAFPPDAQAEIDKRDERIAELTDALTDLRNFISTNTNREMTMKDRFFSAHADFVADNNFDFDAGLLVSGDFVGEEKNEYARMIACTLNDYTKQAAYITRLKGVIVVCKETLVSSISDLQEPNFITLAAWRVKEALAAIQEEGL